MRLRHITAICILALVGVVSSLLKTSYKYAKVASDGIIDHMPDKENMNYVGSRFVILRSFTGRRGPLWEFSYDPNNTGEVDDTIQVSLTGNVIAIDSPDLLNRLYREKRIKAYKYLRKNLWTIQKKYDPCGSIPLSRVGRRMVDVIKEIGLTPDEIKKIDVQIGITQNNKPEAAVTIAEIDSVKPR